MTKPRALVVNKHKHQYDVLVGRGSIYGNPFTHLPLESTQAIVRVPTVQEAIELYARWLFRQVEIYGLEPPGMNDIKKLAGKRLGCSCVEEPTGYGPDTPLVCHAQILASIADNLSDDEK